MSCDSQTSFASYALPLGFSLVITSVFAGISYNALHQYVTSESRAVAVSIIYLASSAVIHILAVWAAFRTFEDHMEVSRNTVTHVTWLVVAWVPILILLATQRSPWITLLLPGLIGLTVVLGIRPSDQSDIEPSSRAFGLTGPEISVSIQRDSHNSAIRVACAAALALECAFVSFFTGYYVIAGCLLAGVVPLPCRVLRLQKNLRINAAPPKSFVLTASTTSMVLFLTVLAFTVYSTNGRLNGAVAAARGGRNGEYSRSREDMLAHHQGEGVQAIIFLTPKRSKEILTPVRNVNNRSVKRMTKNLKIDFDGVYWFFQVPDVRPAANARIVHRDPLKAHVLSLDRWPIRMEAHQRLADPVELKCCRALMVTLTDGDTVPGQVSVEVVLSDGHLPGSPQVSLGEKTIPSSLGNALERQQVNETLRFRVPNGSSMKYFNEITVRIKPAREREIAAPNVAIRSFDLVP